MTLSLPRFVLLEPQFVLRRTMVMVARDMGIVNFLEASNIHQARMLLIEEPYQGMVLDLQEGSPVLDLLAELRDGKFSTPVDVPVVALTETAHFDADQRLASLGVTHVFRKPVKVSELLKVIAVPG